MKLTALPAAARLAMPWKNGGGVTREVAVSPVGSGFAFDWRVSIAKVDKGGPFSRFTHVDRVLVVLKGAMRLAVDGQPPVALDPSSAPFHFCGEAVCQAELASPVVDLNLMTRRGLQADIRRLSAAAVVEATAATHLFVATAPSVFSQIQLAALDAVRLDGAAGSTLPLNGEGWWISIGGAG